MTEETKRPKATPPTPPTDTTMEAIMKNRLETFDAIHARCRKLFEEKNTQYGDSISSTGVLGAVVALIGIAARLRPLVLLDPAHGKGNREVLADVFKDIQIYASIALIMLSDNNWDGE